jgi:hypothetical protein
VPCSLVVFGSAPSRIPFLSLASATRGRVQRGGTGLPAAGLRARERRRRAVVAARADGSAAVAHACFSRQIGQGQVVKESA